MEEKSERVELLAIRLYDAALEGDLPSLLTLLQEDPFILHRCPILIDHKTGQLFNQSPLHVAANLGHLEIVKALLKVTPDLCLVTDHQGRNPVHVAAVRGHKLVIEQLVRAKPQAARERTSCGETVLHLCIKHNHPDTLEFLVDDMDYVELLNSKDSDGNTILHLAVAAKQTETIKSLLKNKNLEKNVINISGLTAMDIYTQSKKNDTSDKEIGRSLKRAKAVRAKKLLKKAKKDPHSRLENHRNALMVVASLIATMAFQVGVSPPGGTYQDTNSNHTAGSPIILSGEAAAPDGYNLILIWNTIAFVSSLSVIFLLISGLPCKRLFVAILMITMWIAVSATTLTYSFSLTFLLRTSKESLWDKWVDGLMCVLIIWLILMLILLLIHVIRFIKKLIKFLVKACKGLWTKATSCHRYNFHINHDAYEKQGPLYLSTFFAMSYGVGFATLSATIVHVVLFHGSEIWEQSKASIKNKKMDIHTKLMKRYKEAPEWWFWVILVVNITATIFACEYYKEQVQLPWWGVLLACGIAFVFTLPTGIITAITNQSPGLNIISECIIGYIYPGYPVANMCFKIYGFISLKQAITSLCDFKLGHYMKIPPRTMFMAQVVGTLISCIVYLGTAWWLMETIPDICKSTTSNII